MKRLLAVLLATTTLALASASGQTVADKVANPLPNSGLQTCALGGVTGLCANDPKKGLVSIPLAEVQVPHSMANPFVFGGGTAQPTLNMQSGSATINYTPFANNLALYTAGLMVSTVRQTAVREFVFSVDQKAMIGDSSITNGQDGAVAFYADQECGGSNQRCWLGNFVSRIDPEWNGKQYNGPEINLNTNGSLDMSGAVADPSGLTQTSWALPITGVSYGSGNKGKFTGGVVIGSDGTSPFGEGFAVLPGTVKNVAFADWGGGAISHLAVGAHTYGFSAVGLIGSSYAMSGGPNFEAASGNGYFGRNKANTADFELIGTDGQNNVVIGAGGVNSITPQVGMNFPNNVSVGFANAAGTATIVGVGTDNSNRVVIGTNAAAIIAGTNLVPVTDAGTALGSSGLRFNGVWANLHYMTPGYTKANLPSGQPAGTMTWCTNCRKPGQSAGNGNGMAVTFDGGSWSDTTGNAAQS